MCGIVSPLLSGTNALVVQQRVTHFITFHHISSLLFLAFWIWVAMQCGSPSQNDRLSKKLTAIEQRLEDILMRISQESGSTEACLRDLTLSIAKLTSTVTSVDQRLAGNASSFPNAPRVGTASSPRSPRSPRSENRGNRGDRGDRGDRESRMVPMKSSKTDVSAILRSDRSEILAMESQPLLDSQVDVGRKPKEAKKPKAQKLGSLMLGVGSGVGWDPA